MATDSSKHKHIWDKWYPYSKSEIWRKCVIPGCLAKEVKKA